MTKEEFMSVVKVSDKYYSKKKSDHAMSVMNYVLLDPRYELMTDEEKNMVAAIAYAHDVIEDTKCSWSELEAGINNDEDCRQFYLALDLLTRRHEMTYYDYIETIVKSKNLFAIMVKQADMKDHLIRKSTLTKKLKEKYEPVMPMLLRA